jgi:tetratricopeptide (TPR) repeat protein
MKGCSTKAKDPSTTKNHKTGNWKIKGGATSLFIFLVILLSPLNNLTPQESITAGSEEMLLEYLKNEQFAKAIALEKDIIKKNPGTEVAAKAQFNIAGIYLNFMDDYKNAFAAYKTLVDVYPNSPYVEDSYYRLALLSLKVGHIEETAKHLDNLKTAGTTFQAKANFLSSWLEKGRNVFYYQNDESLMATSLSLEFIFIMLWLGIGLIDKIGKLYKKKSFWIIFTILITILAFKLSVQYALFELVDNI